MIKVWILTLLIDGASSGAYTSLTYNYTSQKECEIAAQFQKKTLERSIFVDNVTHSCFVGYIPK